MQLDKTRFASPVPARLARRADLHRDPVAGIARTRPRADACSAIPDSLSLLQSGRTVGQMRRPACILMPSADWPGTESTWTDRGDRRGVPPARCERGPVGPACTVSRGGRRLQRKTSSATSARAVWARPGQRRCNRLFRLLSLQGGRIANPLGGKSAMVPGQLSRRQCSGLPKETRQPLAARCPRC